MLWTKSVGYIYYGYVHCLCIKNQTLLYGKGILKYHSSAECVILWWHLVTNPFYPDNRCCKIARLANIPICEPISKPCQKSVFINSLCGFTYRYCDWAKTSARFLTVILFLFQFTHIAIWGSIISWFVFFAIYSHIWPAIPFASEMLGQADMVFRSALFWMGLILIPFTVLTRDILWKVYVYIELSRLHR